MCISGESGVLCVILGQLLHDICLYLKRQRKGISVTSCNRNPSRSFQQKGIYCGELDAYKFVRKDRRSWSQGAATGPLVSRLVFPLSPAPLWLGATHKAGSANFSRKRQVVNILAFVAIQILSQLHDSAIVAPKQP